jgi:redox-sensitive bicupin YhaK (pirin superfamily)
MISKIPSSNRHYIDHGWLKTYHLFSFADYFDPRNMNFGTLRVFNDDSIDGQTGFGEHHHENMEIVTIVLIGELTHKDSMGNIGTIKAGEVQYMSAGTGVTHAEMNAGDEPVHLYQIWILPDEEGLPPLYSQRDFREASKNVLVPVASGQSKEGSLPMRTDSTIYTSKLEAGQTIRYSLPSGRGAFIYITQGNLKIYNTEFETGDQARIRGAEELTITALKDTQFILIDVSMNIVE